MPHISYHRELLCSLQEANKSPEMKDQNGKSRPLDKQLKELSRVLQHNKDVKGVWTTEACNSLERPLGDLERLAGKSAQADQQLAEDLSSRECLPLLVEVRTCFRKNTLLEKTKKNIDFFKRASLYLSKKIVYNTRAI